MLFNESFSEGDDRPADAPYSAGGGDGVVLRACAVGDWPAVNWLEVHGGLCSQGQPAATNDAADDDLDERPDEAVWVADARGEVVGVIGLRVTETGAHGPRGGRVAHVCRLCVAPAWRGRHIFPRLVRVALDHARERDCLKVVVHTFADAGRAKAFVESVGFNYAGSRQARGEGVLEFYMDLYARVSSSAGLRGDGGQGALRPA